MTSQLFYVSQELLDLRDSLRGGFFSVMLLVEELVEVDVGACEPWVD